MQRIHLRDKTLVLVVASVMAVLLPQSVRAQLRSGPGGTGTTTPPVVGGAPYIEAWVDPCKGRDPTPAGAGGRVGCPDRPFLTLNAAITAVSNAQPGPSPMNPGLVHANPGVYGPAGNGESFPVYMAPYVNVQGVGAKRCVIRGDQTQPRGGVFYPLFGEDCTCGARLTREVLVDFSLSFDLEGYEEFIDGFTFQGGEVQVYIDLEMDLIARVSNCVFDMLDHLETEVGVPAPNFGTLMVSIYCPSPNLPEGYFTNRVNILNNTYIQGWSPWVGREITARPDSVAICDVNDPLCGNPFPDPDPTLRGVGSPSIQNNLIRYCETPRTPLLGIDLSDVTAINAVGIAVPTDAFDPTLPGLVPGTVDVSGTFCSTVLGALPVPAVNPIPRTGGVDPAFVGEMLSSLFGNPTSLSRDWRILPDSNMIDAGLAPVGGVLAAANGTTYVEPALIPESSFDFDGEVYGNLRIIGGAPDIGFDEYELWINAGGYGNDTRTYGGPCPIGCPGTPGVKTREFILPSGGAYNLFRTWTPMIGQGYLGPFVCPGAYWWAFSTQFGTAVLPSVVPGFGIIWLQVPGFFLGIIFDNPVPFAPVTPIAGYTPPCDPLTPHSFGIATESASLRDACLYLNEQLIFVPTAGGIVLSNLQCSYDGPSVPAIVPVPPLPPIK